MGEKKLFIIRTVHKGEVKFTLMSLEESKEAYVEGLKAVIENLILKLGLNIERKERDIFYFIHAQGFSNGCEKSTF